MRRLETLAVELARLLAVSAKHERLRLRPREQLALHGDMFAAAERVRAASREAMPLLDADARRAVSTARTWHASRTAIVDAIAAVGAALSRVDDAPDTPRDLDDPTTEAP